MKKTLLILLTFFSSIMIVSARECKSRELIELRENLNSLTYTLTYTDYYVDMNGDFLEGYFKLNFSNLPHDYLIGVANETGVQYSNFENGIHLKGGVYELEIYHNNCDEVIKKYEIRIPFYKQYCDLNKKCEENKIWFDGTYENKSKNHANTNKNKISTRLVIVLVSLIVILVGGIIVIIIERRRQSL